MNGKSLATLVPHSSAPICELFKAMRLSTKRCGVSLRVLRQVESGRLNVRTARLEKLLRPFGYRIGIVHHIG